VKWKHLIPPVLAAVVVVVWNARERRTLHALEDETRQLRGQINTVRPATDGDGSAAGGLRVATPKRQSDWRDLARRAMSAQGTGGKAGLNAMLDFEKRLADMDDAELMAALDAVGGLDLDPAQRTSLEEMIIAPLIERMPDQLLERFADRIGNDGDGVGWQLPGAMAAWAKKDPAAAAAWMDRQLAAGLFESKSLDGRSQARMEFEGALAASLLEQGGAAAAGRIAALPEDQRREALEQIDFSELSPAARAAYAGLVRGLVPQDERDGSFTHVASQIVPNEGFGGVDAFMDAIHASATERQVMAREAANARITGIAGDRAVTRGDVEEMRAWVEQQAPGTADKVTGEALGDAAQDGPGFDFEAAAKLALEYHRASAGDDVLAAFLESFAARSNLDQAVALAREIRDPKRREEILGILE
jgi:hypothetical protein